MRQAMRRAGSPLRRRWALGLALVTLAVAGCSGQAPRTSATATPIAPDARLAGQVVYVAVGLSAGLSTPGLIEALNAQTGAVMWRAQTYTTAGTPVVSGGTLYAGADDGTVRSFDAATGKAGWSFTRTAGVSAQSGQDAYVAEANGVVYATSDGGAAYALDAATGKQRWLFTLPVGDHVYTVPTLANGLVYFAAGGLNGAVYALDAATGKPRWTYPQASGFDGQPVVAGGVVYAGGTATLYALDAQTGASRWSYDATSNILSAAGVGSDLIYIGALDGSVVAVHATDRSKVWSFQTGGSAGNALIARGAALTLDGQTLYVGSEGGTVYALAAATGKRLWSVALNSPIDSPPASLDGTLFVTTEAGDVVALRESDGASVWRAQTHGFIIAAPLVASPSGA